MNDPAGPIGLVLAGGRARRLGGGDKTLRLLAGRPLLAVILDRLTPQCRGVLLSANGPADRFAAFGLPVVPDHPEDADAGPLAGVLAGLDAIAASHPDCPWVMTVPGDAPFLPSDLARRLAEALDAQHAAVAVATSGGRTHALTALWPVGLRHRLRRALREEGHRRATDVLAEVGTARVEWPIAPFDPFHNVNVPADLVAAAHWAETLLA